MRKERNRKRLRLTGYDYGESGGYFITICTRDRKRILSSVGAGHLAGPVVELTDIGIIVDSLIQKIPQVYSSVYVEKYVIMPNHVHLLLRIAGPGPAGCPAPTVPKIIGALKSMAVREAGIPLWQRGFYDYIIRSAADYLRIWQYIDTNPAKWEEDEYYAP